MGFGMKDTLAEYVDDVENEALYEYCYILGAHVQTDDTEDCDKATVEGFRVEYAGINMKLTVYGFKNTKRVDGITSNKMRSSYLTASLQSCPLTRGIP